MVAPLVASFRSPLVFPGGNPGFDPSHIAANSAVMSIVATPTSGINLLTGTGPGSTSNSSSAMTAYGPSIVVNYIPSWQKYPVHSGSYPAGGTTSDATIGLIFSIPSYSSNVGSLFGWGPPSGGWDGIYISSTGALNVEYHGAVYGTGFTVALNTPYFLAISNKYVGSGSTVFVIVNLLTGAIKTGTFASGYVYDTNNYDYYFIGTDYSLVYANIYAASWALSYLPISALLLWAQRPWDFWYPNALQKLPFIKKLSSGTAYSLSSNYSTYSINMQSTQGINAQRKLAAAQTTVNINAQPLLLFNAQRKLVATQATYNINMQSTQGINVQRKLTATQTTVNINPFSVGFNYQSGSHNNYSLSANYQTVNITAEPLLVFNAQRKLVATQAAININAQPLLIFNAGRYLSATFAGVNINMQSGNKLNSTRTMPATMSTTNINVFNAGLNYQPFGAPLTVTATVHWHQGRNTLWPNWFY